jgi:hypothetical protein
MKIVIKEDKRDRIAKQILTEEFSGMDKDVNYQTDSMGEQMVIHYSNGDGTIMIYGSASESLYICEDVVSPIRMLSYTPKQVRDVVGEWFSEFFELPVELVHQVNKEVLN